jgi:hypothetical protein
MSESEQIQPSPSPGPSHQIQGEPHGHAHGDGHGRPHAEGPFTGVELEEFHKDDRRSGGMVVGLMAGIFSIGLLLYITVAYFVIVGA